MRTTISFADDVAAAIEDKRRREGIGVSEAVNGLVRAGLTAKRPVKSFRQTTHDLGAARLDFDNVAETLETLDGPAAR